MDYVIRCRQTIAKAQAIPQIRKPCVGQMNVSNSPSKSRCKRVQVFLQGLRFLAMSCLLHLTGTKARDGKHAMVEPQELPALPCIRYRESVIIF